MPSDGQGASEIETQKHGGGMSSTNGRMSLTTVSDDAPSLANPAGGNRTAVTPKCAETEKRGIKRSIGEKERGDFSDEDHSSFDGEEDNDGEMKEKLEAIWNDLHQQLDEEEEEEDSSGTSRKEKIEDALEQTYQLVSAQVNILIRYGLDTFTRLESLSRAHNLAQDDIQAKASEIQRLKLAEEKQRKTIQNLLHSVEVGKSQARDVAQQAVVEARLRSELSLATKEKNEALRLSQQYQTKCSLLEEQLRQVKSKLTRVTKEKIHMERDHRATLSLAKSLETDQQSSSSLTSDTVEYYKRKTNELAGQVQGLQAVVSEKNRQLEDFEREADESLAHDKKHHRKDSLTFH